MTKRGSLSPMRRLKVWEAHRGICHICGLEILGFRDGWDVEHVIPLAMGGTDDESNTAPAHKACHAPKTKQDVADIARAKRRKAKHLGIRRSGAPMQGSRASKWKKPFNGPAVLR